MSDRIDADLDPCSSLRPLPGLYSTKPQPYLTVTQQPPATQSAPFITHSAQENNSPSFTQATSSANLSPTLPSVTSTATDVSSADTCHLPAMTSRIRLPSALTPFSYNLAYMGITIHVGRGVLRPSYGGMAVKPSTNQMQSASNFHTQQIAMSKPGAPTACNHHMCLLQRALPGECMI